MASPPGRWPAASDRWYIREPCPKGIRAERNTRCPACETGRRRAGRQSPMRFRSERNGNAIMERIASRAATPRGRRVFGIIATWLLVGAALYVAWWGAMILITPDFSVQRLVRILVGAAPFYAPIFVAAVAVPAALHLIAGRLARTWSWLALAGSILVPGLLVLLIRSDYVAETARGSHIEGKGLWGAFAFVAIFGMYFAACALTFAIAARRDAGPDARGRSANRLIVLAAAALLLHAANAVSQFAPFFAFVYG